MEEWESVSEDSHWGAIGFFVVYVIVMLLGFYIGGHWNGSSTPDVGCSTSTRCSPYLLSRHV